MKKICLLLVLLLTVALGMNTALASIDPIDLTYVRESDVLAMDISDSGNAFIYTTLDAQTIEHADSLEAHPSDVYSDIIVIDYYGDQYPCWRFWIDYRAESFLGITSVTMEYGGKSYTFSGLGDKDHMSTKDGYVQESIPIQMGYENVLFWSAFMLDVESLEDKSEILTWSIPVVLHGTEDVTTTINGDAITDFYVMGLTMANINGMSALADNEGSVCTVEELPDETI
jgi:hypothetical protein